MTEKIKLLVVDDNDLVRSLIRLSFKKYPKVEIYEAINAEQGLEKFESLHPDIVFSDIMMLGDIDGLDLCKQIKSSNHICLVVLITAKAQPSDVELGMQAGADIYIAKPFRPSNIIDILEKWSSLIDSSAIARSD